MSKISSWLDRHSDWGLFLLRLFIGSRLIYGVIDNVVNWEDMLRFSIFLREYRFPLPLASAIVSVYAQLIAGILIILGWKIRYAAALMIINFLIALIVVHRNDSVEAMTAAAAILFCNFLFLFQGPGRISLDKKIEMKLIPFFMLVILPGCTKQASHDKDTEVITELLATERKAHFQKDVSLFMSEFSDSMISINHGLVTRASPQATRDRIKNYFDRVEFLKWDDIETPMIRFSNDGSMAYAIVQKQVIVSIKDSAKKETLDTTDFAWLSVYRKMNDGSWKIECNASTNK